MASPHLGTIFPNAFRARFPGLDSLISIHAILEHQSLDHIADLYAAIRAIGNLWASVPLSNFTSLSKFTAYVEKYARSPKHAFYAILIKSSGRVIRHVRLEGFNFPNQVIEVGLVIYRNV
jgi:hypothetical protein